VSINYVDRNQRANHCTIRRHCAVVGLSATTARVTNDFNSHCSDVDDFALLTDWWHENDDGNKIDYCDHRSIVAACTRLYSIVLSTSSANIDRFSSGRLVGKCDRDSDRFVYTADGIGSDQNSLKLTAISISLGGENA